MGVTGCVCGRACAEEEGREDGGWGHIGCAGQGRVLGAARGSWEAEEQTRRWAGHRLQGQERS